MSKRANQQRIASSARYATEFNPVRRLRAIVIASGWLALLAGVAMILHLPLPPAARVVLLLVWITDAVRDLRRQARGQARVRRLTIDASGRVTCTDPAGKKEELQLLAGSLVVSRFAWLRLGFSDGGYYAEPLVRDFCRSGSWRRLQLVWRHAL